MTDPFQNGFGAQAIDQEAVYRALQGSYVASGCSPSKGANALEVDVASGTINVDNSEVSVSSQTVTLASGDADPRKDIVYLDSTGTANVAAGTAAPAKPSGETRRDTYQPQPVDLSGTAGVVVAEVWVPASASDIASGDISDRRPVLTFEGQPNVPGWEVDGTASFSGDSSHTYNMNSTYDQVQVHVAARTDLFEKLGLRINGHTDTNYDQWNKDATNSQSRTEVKLSDAIQVVNGYFTMSGDWIDRWEWERDGLGHYILDGPTATSAQYFDGGGSLSSFTLFNISSSTNFSIDVEVLGKNVNP